MPRSFSSLIVCGVSSTLGCGRCLRLKVLDASYCLVNLREQDVVGIGLVQLALGNQCGYLGIVDAGEGM